MGSSAFDLVNKNYDITTYPNGHRGSGGSSSTPVNSWDYISSGKFVGDLLDATYPGLSSGYYNLIDRLSDSMMPFINYKTNLAYATGKDPSDIQSLLSQSLDTASNRLYDITDGLIGKPASPSSGSGASGSGPSGVGSSVGPEYINAALAQHYGMSSATAYQEALSNTSYQRAVADMQRAGLNPAVLFGAGRASSAQGVSYIAQHAGSSGGSPKDDYKFTPGMYNLISTIAGLAGSAITKNPNSYFAFSTVAKSIMSIMSER